MNLNQINEDKKEIEIKPELHFDDPEEKIEFGNIEEPFFGDLESITSRRYLRALVPFGPTFYYFKDKTPKGYSYDILNEFEKKLNKNIGSLDHEIRILYIPVDRDNLIPLLEQGYGDIAVGEIIETEERKQLVNFSNPTFKGLKEVIVAHVDAPKLESVYDLSGKQVIVRKKSDFHSSLLKLNDTLLKQKKDPVIIKEAFQHLDEEDIVQLVDHGTIQYTIMLKEIAEHWKNELQNIIIYEDFPIQTNRSAAWAIRKSCPDLELLVNDFLKDHSQGSLYGNILFKKYFKSHNYIQNHKDDYAINAFNETKHIFQKFGDQYDLDWLLIVAQGFQESGLDPSRKSSAGAVGIMQIKPSTASWKPIGIENVFNNENNIHAATKYVRYIIDNYFKDSNIDSLNRHLLALASYNAGPSRIHDLRKKTAERGLDPNIWFDHVELLTAEYVGKETVHYVSNIYKYYASYHLLVQYEKISGKEIGL